MSIALLPLANLITFDTKYFGVTVRCRTLHQWSYTGRLHFGGLIDQFTGA